MNMEAKDYKIISGPSLEEILNSLKSEKGNESEVEFVLDEKITLCSYTSNTLSLAISLLKIDEETKTCRIFEGWCEASHSFGSRLYQFYFRGIYDIQSCSGQVKELSGVDDPPS